MAATSFKLNTGAQIPSVGLGTWQSEPGKVKAAVAHAVKNGYKLIDCAYCYGNEVEVGEGLKEAFAAGVKREDIFVVTKVWATYNTRAAEGLEKSLKNLGLDYVDLFLVHWPLLLNPNGNDDKFPKNPDGSRDVIRDWDHLEGWRQMESVYESGKAKAIGVSNYSTKYLQRVLDNAKVIPAVNQIENHPWLPQSDITALSKANGIHIMAYSPLGSTGSPLATLEPIVKVAEKHKVSPQTILISWQVASGRTVVPKSVTPERIDANKNIVKLSDEETKLITDYSKEIEAKKEWKRFVYPPFGINFGFPDKQ